MQKSLMIFGVTASLALAGSVLAQTTVEPLAETPTTTPATPTTTTPVANNTGAYDALSPGNKKIVSAIYEAQLGSAQDTGTASLRSRDDIAAMRAEGGWGQVYQQMQQQGLVTEKNLGQAISSQNHSLRVPATAPTVISTAGGEQISAGAQKADAGSTTDAKAAKGNSAAARADTGKATIVTSASGAPAAAPSSAGGIRGASNSRADAAKAK